MTTELEQEFFKVFNIKPTFRYIVQSELPIIGTDHCRPVYDLTKKQFKNLALSRAKGYKLVEVVKIYPEITDRKLLKLICKAHCLMFSIQGSSIELLKENILKEFIYWQKDVDKSEIQQLFKEGK